MKSEKEIQEEIGKMEKEKEFANSGESNCSWTKAEDLQLRTLYWILAKV